MTMKIASGGAGGPAPRQTVARESLSENASVPNCVTRSGLVTTTAGEPGVSAGSTLLATVKLRWSIRSNRQPASAMPPNATVQSASSATPPTSASFSQARHAASGTMHPCTVSASALAQWGKAVSRSADAATQLLASALRTPSTLVLPLGSASERSQLLAILPRASPVTHAASAVASSAPVLCAFLRQAATTLFIVATHFASDLATACWQREVARSADSATTTPSTGSPSNARANGTVASTAARLTVSASVAPNGGSPSVPSGSRQERTKPSRAFCRDLPILPVGSPFMQAARNAGLALPRAASAMHPRWRLPTAWATRA